MSSERGTFQQVMAHPACIYNSIQIILKTLATRADLERHVHIMFEYDLDLVCPSSDYVNIIDEHLARTGVAWRVHSYHVRADKETVRCILRKTSLQDLVDQQVTFAPYELRIHDIMHKFAQQTGVEYILGSTNVAIFATPQEHKYQWVFTRDFDMWEYHDLHPEKGWVSLDAPEESASVEAGAHADR